MRPTTRDELRQALQEQGFRRTGSDAAQYETWKGPDGVKIDIRPNGEVIRTQRVPRT
ncbi:TPA: septum formation inhibitor Maf, partial [Neisseria gonorrhoeae]